MLCRLVVRAWAVPPAMPPPDPSSSDDFGSSEPPHWPAAGRGKQTFRFWIDYQVLSSPLSTRLLERALKAVGGVCTGGPPKLDPITSAVQKHKDYGYMHMGEWDFLWSITAKAMLAAEILRPGQMVGCLPGFLSITRKTSLVSNLRLVYGSKEAFTIVPRTFKLPDEMDDWAEWLEQHPQEDTGLWMLKNNKQRGEGLRLVHTRDASKACFETTTRPGMEGMTLYRWYLAQQYITRPLLLGGLKFGVRLWVLVPGVRPLRAYVHQRGLALLSSHRYDETQVVGQDGGVAAGHITNYAQNENSDVWSLQQLASHLGPPRWQKLWGAMIRSTAMLFAAALPRVNEVLSYTAVPPQSCFQFFGLDYLVDSDCKPWLLEANATPSMKVEHARSDMRKLIHDQKWPVMQDMVAMLGICPERFNGPLPKEHRDLSFMAGELSRRGGFSPIMHHFPTETPDGLRTITWHPLDHELRAYTKGSQYQAHVLDQTMGQRART